MWRQPLCGLAKDVDDNPAAARQFFELLFKPTLIGTPPALFTGYYEPVLEGSPTRTARFAYPIYRRPPELRDGAVWYDRATIESGGGPPGLPALREWQNDPAGRCAGCQTGMLKGQV